MYHNFHTRARFFQGCKAFQGFQEVSRVCRKIQDLGKVFFIFLNAHSYRYFENLVEKINEQKIP